jgi:NADPH:quinone reductase-like Zn-dependent oxidoreductase
VSFSISKLLKRSYTLFRHGLQFAVASGAIVIATSSSDQKLAIAKKLGAAHVINYNTTPNWDEEVLKFTNGHGADIVLEVCHVIR